MQFLFEADPLEKAVHALNHSTRVGVRAFVFDRLPIVVTRINNCYRCDVWMAMPESEEQRRYVEAQPESEFARASCSSSPASSRASRRRDLQSRSGFADAETIRGARLCRRKGRVEPD